GFVIAGPLSGKLSDRYGARPFATGGMLLAAATYALMMTFPANFSYLPFGAVMLFSGIGGGLFASPNTSSIMNSVPARDRGAASGMRVTFASTGMPLSMGLFFTLLVGGLNTKVPAAMLKGLVANGVPVSSAAALSHVPPLGYVFAAFLGYNPLKTLLGPAVLSHVSAAQAANLTSRAFFPQLIGPAFVGSLSIILGVAVFMSLIAAVASAFRGGKYVHVDEESKAQRHLARGGRHHAPAARLAADANVRVFGGEDATTMVEAEATAETASDAFVHLHVHSEFSLLDGAARIPELVARAKAMGQPAVAVTDHGVLYGAVELYTEAVAAGVKPIVGCEVYMAPRSHRDKEGRADRDPHHLVLLARDNTGYANLVQLSTIAHLQGHYYKPRIDKELLAAHSEGLICLSGCVGGELPQIILSGDLDAAERVARQHLEIFGADNYFLEIQDHGMTEETAVREGLVEIARRTGIPLICTNDSHYIDAADAEAHDILLCLQTGARREDEKRFRFHGPHFYMASSDEMRRRFNTYGEAASNTLAVASRCDWKLELGHHHLPAYSPIPEGLDADTYLAELCQR